LYRLSITLHGCDRRRAGDDATVPIDQNRAARAVLTKGPFERRAAAIGAAIRTVRIRVEIDELKRTMTRPTCVSHNLRLSGARAPVNCEGTGVRQQAAGTQQHDEPASK
jgi:hypothetical protein